MFQRRQQWRQPFPPRPRLRSVPLTPDAWTRITEVFDALLAMPDASRERALAALDAAEPAVASEVRSLLAAHADDAFLEGRAAHPIVDPGQPASRLLGQVVGGYRIEREVGRGGMGVVYEAHHVDPALAKRVAIKTLPIGLERPEAAWRFRREQQILARLEHPNIATLYDGGTTPDGLPYLAMEYVDGTRIDAWCDAHRLDVRARLDLFRQVCAAVEFAHTKLVVHRDLKPTNILVTSDGVVKLLDFGIAKLVTPDHEVSGDPSELTHAGAMPLTAAYASPEQLRGGEVTTVSDVYSLGVVLYRLLTGASPHATDAATPVVVRDANARDAVLAPSDTITPTHPAQCGPTDLRTLRSQLRGELDAIVLMALRAEPARRYASAAALSADVLRYLKGLPVEARPDTLGYRVRKFVRRRRAVVVSAGVAATALVAGAVIATLSAREARQEADRVRRVSTVLQNLIGAGASTTYREVPTMLTVLDSARNSIAVEFPDDPAARAALYEVFSASYFNFERPALALLMIDSARVLHTRLHGARSVEVARDLAASANTLISLGATDSAFARQRQAVALMRAAKPRPVRDLTEAEVELGFLEIVLLSQADSALPRLAQALATEYREPAPRWDMIAMGEAVTILPWFYRGDRVRADSAAARAAAALRRDSTASHSRRSALAFTGQALLLRGQPAAAEPVIRELLRATELRLGAAHYLTAQAQNLLARVLLDLRRYDEGTVLVDSAIANLVAAPGHDPLYLGEMYLTRATLAMQVGALDAAQASIAQARAEHARLGAQQQPILDVSILFTTGALHEARGQLREAREAFTAAATEAHARLQPGARNTGLADARLAAFNARHPAR